MSIKLKPSKKKLRLYGIYCNKKRTLIKVSLDYSDIEMEFDLEEYNEEEYTIVQFYIVVTV
jgi:hypothetical protein